MTTFHIEVTDTYGGEANYCWVRHYLTEASSPLGAIQKLARSHGKGWRRDWDSGDTARFNLKGACICAFVMHLDDSSTASFNGTERI